MTSTVTHGLSPVGANDLWRAEVAVVRPFHAYIVLHTLVEHRLCVAAPDGRTEGNTSLRQAE